MAGWVTELYPGGSKQVWGPGLAFKQAPCKLVLHTTEGNSYPDYRYDGKKREPNVTANISQRTWRQHIPLDQGAYALQANGVSTNTMGAIQIELIGYAATMKDLSGDDLTWLSGLLRMLCKQAGIPIQCSVPFDGAASYGVNGSVRLSDTQWTVYRGILGHQHVPTNSHWDPGNLPIERWVAAINGVTPPPAPLPDTEPETDDDMASLIGIIFDQGTGDGFGSTAVYNETIGWVQTSVGLGDRGSYMAYSAIGDALGFKRDEKHVDYNGWVLSQLFKNPSSDVDVIVDVNNLAAKLSELIPGAHLTDEDVTKLLNGIKSLKFGVTP